MTVIEVPSLDVVERMGLLEQFRSCSVPMKEVANFDPAEEIVWRADGNYVGKVVRGDVGEWSGRTQDSVRSRRPL
ncbi:hypothetical protein [Cryptosporangium sp. NPDC051539]|uniref:hypothetical protein n=1 Tax=Cryptosporangium sp. NPDC051539 TaxID=3363962 RepID=UPI0037A2D446